MSKLLKIKSLIGVEPEELERFSIEVSQKVDNFPHYKRSVKRYVLSSSILKIFNEMELIKFDNELREVKFIAKETDDKLHIEVLNFLIESIGSDVNKYSLFSNKDEALIEKKASVNRYWCFDKDHTSLHQEEFDDSGYGISFFFNRKICELAFINVHNM